MRSNVVVFVVFALAGCVSGGLRDPDDTVSVPVYGTAEEVPCEYRLMYVLSVQTRSSQVNSVSAREGILGRAGARAGADAVIMLPDGDPASQSGVTDDRPVTTGRRGQGGGTRITQTYSHAVTLNGEAIRCVEKN